MNASTSLGFEPTPDRIFVLKEKKDEKTASGIILAPVAQKEFKGEVISVGLRKDGSVMGVRAGDTVTFDGDRGFDTEINGTDYRVLAETEILWYTVK